MRMIHASGIRGGAPGKLIKILLIDSFDPLLTRLPYTYLYISSSILVDIEKNRICLCIYIINGTVLIRAASVFAGGQARRPFMRLSV